MRLAGSTFARSIEAAEGQTHSIFDNILKEAIDLVEGGHAAPDEADEQRERLLAGFRWILVDEYQDIKELEYNLISALAGRTKRDPELRLNLFAVGDDDQNIYAFSGSSTKYIKRFEEDYRASPSYMTENYRSSKHIIAAANSVIGPADQRMKEDRPITVNRDRTREHPGGEWARIDPVTQGKVQILPAGDGPIAQAQLVVGELRRMAGLDPEWDWSNCAIIARNWGQLDPVRALCQLMEIPVQVSREDFTATWQLRETQALLSRAQDRTGSGEGGGPVRMAAGATRRGRGMICSLRLWGITGWRQTTKSFRRRPFGNGWPSGPGTIGRRQHGLLLTSAHRAKGLEFDHVAILDGNWQTVSRGEDADAPRRLYYVAMTRARRTLTLAMIGNSNPFLEALRGHPSVLIRQEQDQSLSGFLEMDQAFHRLSLSDVQLSLGWLLASGSPSPPGYRRAIPRRSHAGQDQSDPLGVGHQRWHHGGEIGTGVQGTGGTRRGDCDRAGDRLLG